MACHAAGGSGSGGAGAWAAQAARVGGAAALLLGVGLLLAPVATLGSVFHARHGQRKLDCYPFRRAQTRGSTVLHVPPGVVCVCATTNIWVAVVTKHVRMPLLQDSSKTVWNPSLCSEHTISFLFSERWALHAAAKGRANAHSL